MGGIARKPWAQPKALYALYDEAYPLPAPDGLRKAAPCAPYLVYAPEDFALSLAFSGGGNFANGRFMFDADASLWSGMNWMPGSQSGVNKSTGGGVGKYSPNGAALSPPIMSFRGMGIDGVGWATAVTKERVWISSFNGKILVMDFDGRPVASESDFPFKEKFLGLMGIGVADNGDVWIADGSDNQLLFFPGALLLPQRAEALRARHQEQDAADQRRRRADDLPRQKITGQGQGIELVAGTGRELLDLAPYLLARPGHPRRHLETAAAQHGEVTLRAASDQLQFDRSKHYIPGRSAISICFPGAFNDLHP